MTEPATNNEDPWRPTAWLGLLLLLGLALGLRLLGLHKGIWLDEYSSTVEAADLSIPALRASNKPPLYPVLLRVWMIAGESDAFLRLLSVLISVVTLLVVAAWLWRHSVLATLIGVALFGLLPIFLRYGQEIRGYGLLLLFVAWAFLLLSRIPGNDEASRRAWAAGAVLALAISTHLTAVFIVPAALVYLMGSTPRSRWSEIAGQCWLPVLLPPIVAFGFFYLVFLQGGSVADIGWMPPPSRMELARAASRLLGSGILIEQFETVGVGPAVASTLVIAGLASLGLLLVWPGTTRGLPALAAAMVYWAQLTLFSLMITPIFLVRTTLAGLVPFVGFVALQSASSRGLRRHATVALIAGFCVLFAWTWTDRLAQEPYESWREVGALIERNWQPGDAVLVYPSYAAGAAARYLPEPIAAETRGIEHLAPPLRNSPPRGAGVFLVVRLDATSVRSLKALDQFANSLARRVGPPRWEERQRNVVVTQFAR